MKKIGLAFGSVVITLIVVEIVLRLTGFGMVRPEFQFATQTGEALRAGDFVPDADVFWREPSGDGSAETRPGKFIRIGDPVPAKGRKFRVITLGDSCTRISTGGQLYSVQLERMLDPRRAEVFNASLPGYTSYQGLAWLRKQLLAWEPDLLVIYFGWNDHWRSTGIADREYAETLKPGHLRLLNLFRKKASPPPLRVAREDYLANLQAMLEEVRAAGGQGWVILAPDNINAENSAFYLKNGSTIPGDDARQLHDTYLSTARDAAGAAAVDLAGVFAELDAMPFLLMRDGIHPTDPGHAVIARVLADRLEREAFRRPGPAPEPVVSALTEMARQRSDAGQDAAAVATYRRAVAADPGFLKARLGQAWLLATSQDEAVRDGVAARALLDPVRDSQTDSPDFLFIAAGAEAACGDFEAAVGMLDRALAAMAAANLDASPFARTVKQARERYRRGEMF